VFEYPSSFFDSLDDASHRSAQLVVPLLIDLVQPKSVVDVGCGRGTWLSVFRDHGIQDVLGLDGDYVGRETLAIPQTSFRPLNLEQAFSVGRIFDLVLCLEVAEHLPESTADTFLDCVAALGPVIAFSAAIPHQGGEHHVNEQWPGYWIERFARRGYRAFDPIRARIWEDPSVDYWYAQNLLVFIHSSALPRLPKLIEARADTVRPPPFVHPSRYLELYEELVDARASSEHWRQTTSDWERAYEDLQRTAEQYEWASKPENMSLRAVLAALPTIVSSAIKRRLKGARARDGA
jgi:SAM-dependent methyltransferase